MTAQGNLARTEEPTADRTARNTARLEERYATALYELALEAGALAAVERDVLALQQALQSAADLRRALSHPLTPRETHARVLRQVAQRLGAGQLTQKFLALVCHKKRQDQLGVIFQAYGALCAARRGEVTAAVRVASPLTPAQHDELVRKLSAKHNVTVKLEVTVDPTVLGGMAVKIGATLYDRTLSSQLSRLQLTLEEAA